MARPPKPARVLLSLGIVLVALPLLLEGAVRLVLFVDVPGLDGVARRLRRPENFAGNVDPDYWKLQQLLKPAERIEPVPGYDATLGWTKPEVRRPAYTHAADARLGERRPLLLYGDSFTDCVTDPVACWEGLLERSPLGERYAALNYGVGGYGVDQMLLALRLSVDNYLERDPVVVVGILVDHDMDRCMYSLFAWPKPTFALVDGALAASGPVVEGIPAFLDEHPPEIRSYAWRWLLHGTELLPASIRRREAERLERFRDDLAALNRALLEALREELDARGLEAFVVLFHGRAWAFGEPPGLKWRETFLIETLDDLGIPWVSSLTALRAEAARSGRPLADYFIEGGRWRNHLNLRGNQAVFRCFEDGLAGRFEGRASSIR